VQEGYPPGQKVWPVQAQKMREGQELLSREKKPQVLQEEQEMVGHESQVRPPLQERVALVPEAEEVCVQEVCQKVREVQQEEAGVPLQERYLP